MAAAMPRHRRLEVLESALGQLEGTAQTMLGEITWLQRELSAVNADAYIDSGGARASRANAAQQVQQVQQRRPMPVTTAHQARLDGRASLSPSFKVASGSGQALGVTAQWFQNEASRFDIDAEPDDDTGSYYG